MAALASAMIAGALATMLRHEATLRGSAASTATAAAAGAAAAAAAAERLATAVKGGCADMVEAGGVTHTHICLPNRNTRRHDCGDGSRKPDGEGRMPNQTGKERR